jgi:hypothetical protein
MLKWCSQELVVYQQHASSRESLGQRDLTQGHDDIQISVRRLEHHNLAIKHATQETNNNSYLGNSLWQVKGTVIIIVIEPSRL